MGFYSVSNGNWFFRVDICPSDINSIEASIIITITTESVFQREFFWSWENIIFNYLRLFVFICKMFSRWGFEKLNSLRHFCWELRLFSIFQGKRWYITLVGKGVCSIELTFVIINIFGFEVHRHIILLFLPHIRFVIEDFSKIK